MSLLVPANLRLSILERAREILSDRKRWGRLRLRQKYEDGYTYCVLGACEQAACDLGLQADGIGVFREGDAQVAYQLGRALGLDAYARERYDQSPWRVNDGRGYETTLEMLDGYIVEVTAGRPRSS